MSDDDDLTPSTSIVAVGVVLSILAGLCAGLMLAVWVRAIL